MPILIVDFLRGDWWTLSLVHVMIIMCKRLKWHVLVMVLSLIIATIDCQDLNIWIKSLKFRLYTDSGCHADS